MVVTISQDFTQDMTHTFCHQFHHNTQRPTVCLAEVDTILKWSTTEVNTTLHVANVTNTCQYRFFATTTQSGFPQVILPLLLWHTLDHMFTTQPTMATHLTHLMQ